LKGKVPRYTDGMEIHLVPEVEDKLNRIAARAGRGADQVIQDLVESYVNHDEWFKQEVRKGVASLDRGEFIEHDEVVSQIERIFRS
jgi:predicted transcriptional regulator